MPTEREYELNHLQNIQSYQREVQGEYTQTIEEIFQAVALYSFADKVFRLSDYPTLKNRIDELMLRFRNRVYNIISSSILKEVGLSDVKNAEIFLKELGAIVPPTPPPAVQEMINAPRRNLRLSDRVWKLHGQFYKEIEMNLYAGISEGKAAARMATDMKQFLKEPDKLFRRVRSAKGKLVLSGPARAYKPGVGVYRSSYKNALRLTRSGTNIAYRTADHERWMRTPFVLGQVIQLSKNHPTNVEPVRCDLLVGVYGKEFKFTGFHINCLCFSTAILPSKEEYSRYEDAILNGTAQDFKFANVVKGMPAQSKQWVIDNAERFENWKSPPLFFSDNPRLIKRVLAE